VSTIIKKGAVICILFFIFEYGSSACTAGTHALLVTNKATIDKEYYLILFGFKFLLSEIVNLNFSDNGTFSLSSDLYDMPAQGSYDRNIVLVKGQGTTGKFYDVDFAEEINIDYTLVGLPLGFRGFYMLGIGKRTFTFYSDGFNVTETFIFSGPGV
jgi:hypothetical protein